MQAIRSTHRAEQMSDLYLKRLTSLHFRGGPTVVIGGEPTIDANFRSRSS